MLTDLLWFLEAKQQHDRQKEQGLAGFLFIILTIVLVWKWSDWVYPFLNWMGVVNFFDEMGMISRYDHVTMFNVVSVILILVFGFAFLYFLIFAVGLVISVFFASEAGQNIMAFALGTVFFIPLMLYARHLYKKQNAPAKETKGQKFVRELNEKETAKFNAWYEDYKKTPLVLENEAAVKQFHDPKEMKAFDRMNWEKYKAHEFTRQEHFDIVMWAALVNRVELELDTYRDNILVFDKLTGRFHFILPSPLPSNVSFLYDQPFEEEEVLLDVLDRYKGGSPYAEWHLFPSLEMEYVLDGEDLYLKPLESATIQPLSVNLDNYRHFHVKGNMMMYKTVDELNNRQDVQDLLNRMNTNAFLLREIVERENIQNDYLNFESLWPEGMEKYKPVYAGQVQAGLNRMAEQGYKWRVKND